jgi:hypothetical protein
MLSKSLVGAASALGILGGVLGAASASAAVYTLGNTQNNDQNTVAATADITAVGNVLTIDLTNKSPSLSAPNQALSDLLIDFTTDIASVSGFTQAGSLIDVNSDGSTTPVAGSPTRWGGSVQSGNLFLTALTGTQPENMIAPATIGSPNNGVLNFNPYIDTTGTFHVTVPNASNLVISKVTFSFGTSSSEFDAPGACTSNCPVINPTGGVPEPGVWALMILGFGGAGAMLRRRRLAGSAA